MYTMLFAVNTPWLQEKNDPAEIHEFYANVAMDTERYLNTCVVTV